MPRPTFTHTFTPPVLRCTELPPPLCALRRTGRWAGFTFVSANLAVVLFAAVIATAQPMPTVITSPQEKALRGGIEGSNMSALPQGVLGVDALDMRGGSRREHGTSFSTYGSVGSMGPGFRTTMLMKTSASTSMEMSIGNNFVSTQPNSNIGGYTVAGSVVPLFLGGRYTFSRLTAGRLEWSQYAAAGAGPIMGLVYPDGGSFWKSVSLLGFRWGAGAYAGLGSQMRFPNGFAINAQLELDGYGFLTPFLGRKSYLGPSFSFAFQFGV